MEDTLTKTALTTLLSFWLTFALLSFCPGGTHTKQWLNARVLVLPCLEGNITHILQLMEGMNEMGTQHSNCHIEHDREMLALMIKNNKQLVKLKKKKKAALWFVLILKII